MFFLRSSRGGGGCCRCLFFSMWGISFLLEKRALIFHSHSIQSMHWLIHKHAHTSTTLFIDILNCDAHAQFQPNTYYFPSSSPFIPSQFNSVARMSLLHTRLQSSYGAVSFSLPFIDGEQVDGMCCRWTYGTTPLPSSARVHSHTQTAMGSKHEGKQKRWWKIGFLFQQLHAYMIRCNIMNAHIFSLGVLHVNSFDV